MLLERFVVHLLCDQARFHLILEDDHSHLLGPRNFLVDWTTRCCVRCKSGGQQRLQQAPRTRVRSRITFGYHFSEDLNSITVASVTMQAAPRAHRVESVAVTSYQRRLHCFVL